MKKMIKKSAIGFMLLSVFLFFGCDQLQDSLSAEQEEDLLEDTGSLEISGKNWYYNGSAASDVSSVSGFLTLTSTKQIAESAGGVSVSFEISYTDASGNSTSVTKSGSGSIAGSGSAFNVDMSPVLSVLTGSGEVTKDNTATAKVKVSGLVCNEGDQKGRALSVFEKSVQVKPLFSTTTLAGVTFSTLNSTLGKSIEIPTQDSELYLSSSAQIAQIDGKVPAGVSISNFELSSDGSTIKITPSVDLYNVIGTVNFTVSGLCSATNTVGYTQTFSVKFGKMVSTTDKWKSAPESKAIPNYSMETMVVSVDSENLYVTINGAVTPSAWQNDQLVIFVDDTSIGDETTTYSKLWDQQVATTQTVNTSVEFTGSDIPSSEWATLYKLRTHSWTQASDYAYYADSTSLEYTIPLSTINENATSSDTFRVAAAWGMYWDDGTVVQFQNGIPGSAFTVSTTTNANDTVSIDFSKALILGSDEEVNVAPSSPKYFVATEASSSSITLAWSEAYNAETYTLVRKGDSDTTLVDAQNVTTYTDADLESGVTYTYELYASNSSGNSAVKTLTASTSALPGSFTVNPSYTFNPDGTSVSLSWTESANATNYKVEYKKSTESDYTTAEESTTGTSATLSSLAMGSYSIKVTAVNDEGSTSASATAALYPTITLDGTMGDSEYWTNENVAAIDSTSIDCSGYEKVYYDISKIYVTNDAENLYVAVDFGSSVPKAWKDDSRITIMIDNQSDSSGNATLSGYNWHKDSVSSNTTISSGTTIEKVLTDYIITGDSNSALGGGITNNTWSYDTSSCLYSGSSAILEYKIPLSECGSVYSAGTVVKVAVSFTVYEYDNNTNLYEMVEICPKNVGTISTTTKWGDTVTLDMTSALTYTIK